MSDKKKIQVAWLIGSYHGRRAKLLSIRDRFSGFEQIDVDAEVSFDYFVNKLREGGCFSSKRLIVVHDMPFMKGTKKKNIDSLIKRLKSIESDCYVIFNGIDENKEKALFDFVKEHGKVFEFESKLERKKAQIYVENRLESMGLQHDSGVVEMIIENCGFDNAMQNILSDNLEMAIIRIVLYVAPNKRISISDVENSIYNLDSFVVWDLINALDNKDYERCNKLLAKAHVISNNIPSAITSIVSTLLWRFRLIMVLRDASKDAKSNSELINYAMEMKKLSKTGSGFSSRFETIPYASGSKKGDPQPAWSWNVIKNCVEGFYGNQPPLDQWSRKDIYRLIIILQEVLPLLRGASNNEAYLLADMVFMKVCNVLNDNKTQKVIDSVKRTKVQ